jgi:hypothetical protein
MCAGIKAINKMIIPFTASARVYLGTNNSANNISAIPETIFISLAQAAK